MRTREAIKTGRISYHYSLKQEVHDYLMGVGVRLEQGQRYNSRAGQMERRKRGKETKQQ